MSCACWSPNRNAGSTRTIPIVLGWVVDPVGSGLVTSLARPGGNVIGLSSLARELVGKRLELLKQAVPGVSRIAVIWHPGDYGERTEKAMLKEADAAAGALGLRLQVVDALLARADGMKATLAALETQKVLPFEIDATRSRTLLSLA